MTTHTELLKKVSLFENVDDEELGRISSLLSSRDCPKDAQIVAQDEPGDALFIIARGRVKVVLYGDNGREVILTILKAGEFFGEMSLVEPAPRSASVTAMSATFLFRLPHDQLRELISDDPNAASILLVQVVKTLSERLRRANQMLSSVDLLADWLAGSMV